MSAQKALVLSLSCAVGPQLGVALLPFVPKVQECDARNDQLKYKSRVQKNYHKP